MPGVGDGWLHRLHPYPKLLLLTWAVLAPFVLPEPAIPILLVLGLLVGLTAGLGAPFLRRVLLGALPLALPIVAINAFFYPGAEEVLARLGPLALSAEGLAFGVPIAGRLLVAFVAIVAFGTTTRPDDLMTALIERGVSRNLAFVVLSALQAIPRTAARAARIADAQRARGLDTGGSLAGRVRGLLPIVGPLVIASLVDIRDRSLALEARAFSSRGPKTIYRSLAMRQADVVVGLLALQGLGGLALIGGLRLVGWLP